MGATQAKSDFNVCAAPRNRGAKASSGDPPKTRETRGRPAASSSASQAGRFATTNSHTNGLRPPAPAPTLAQRTPSRRAAPTANQRLLQSQYPNNHMCRQNEGARSPDSESSDDSTPSAVSSSYLSQSSTRVGAPTQSSFRGGVTQPQGRIGLQAQSSLRMPALPRQGSGRETPPTPGSFRAAPPPAGRGGAYPKGTCDKCDGPHLTDACPIYKKKKEDHPDAWRNFGRKTPLEMGKGGGNFKLRSARVIRQPGDGSCLFHSLAYGIPGTSASTLRRDIASFIKANPNLEIAETPMKDWVKWDSGSTVAQYASRMAVSGWGGGIEMAACSHLKRVNVHVYERGAFGSYKRISCFDVDNARATVHVLYCGGVHYDALVP